MSDVGVLSDGSTRRMAPLILLAAAAVTTLFLLPVAWIGVAAIVGLLVVLYLAATTLDGKIEVPLLLWVASFPLGYYFLSFPRDQALITLDRLTVGVLLVGMCLAPNQKSLRLPKDILYAGALWGCFALATFLSMAGGVTNPMFSFKLTLDGFVLPAIVGWCVVRNFDVRKHLAGVHALTCLMIVPVALAGAVEMATGTDVLPLPGAGLYYAAGILRPNGPFVSNDSFALIGLVTFCFLLFLRRALGSQAPEWQRLLHAVGLGCALATALMPLFRSVMIALLIVVLLDLYFFRSVLKLAVVAAALSCAVAGLVVVSVRAPEVYRDRSEGSNVYSRIGQQMQTLGLFGLSPWIGVGIGNFVNVAELRSQSMRSFGGYESVNYPHNNLGAILSETGVAGFVPYVASNAWLLVVFWKLNRLGTPPARLVWIAFLCVFLSYWINGMSLTAGYYSDLNLWYMFVLMVLYKYAITQHHPYSLRSGPGSS